MPFERRGTVCRLCGYDEWHQNRGSWVCGACGEPAAIPARRSEHNDGKPVSKRSKRGKVVRGVFYRGPKRDRGADPFWDRTPTNIRQAIKEGRLTDFDGTVAGALYDHLRRHRGKGRRISCRDLAAKIRRSVPGVKKSLLRMQSEGELRLIESGRGHQSGGIYWFPSRDESQPERIH